MKQEFILHASRAFFASAWADMADECDSDVIGPGVEIMNVKPQAVGLYDAFGSDVYKAITVPYVEFGSHSLEKDYF